jgi:conjugative transfer region protein TrbK
MMPHLTFRQFVRIAAVGVVVLIVAFTIVRSRHTGHAVVLGPVDPGDEDALVQDLARCRTIAPNETAALETCRRAWAENRRQFFGQARLPQSPTDPILSAPAAPVKNQGRVLPREVEHQQGEAR